MGKKKSSFLRQAGYILEALLVIPAGTFISRLPWNMARAIGRFLGLLVFYIDRKDKKWAYHNLDIIFKDPPLLPFEKDQIVRKLFANITKLAFEYLQLGRLRPENLPEFLRVENHKAVDEALCEKKGVLIITAHLGNWEYLGVLGSRLGYNVATVLKRQHNPHTDRWLGKIRGKNAGVKCFYHGNEFHHRIALHLKQNGVLGILADQRQISRPFIAPFFGAPCATADGPARLHLWFEAPMVFAFSIQQPDGKYRVSFDGPYRFQRRGDFAEDCLRITTFIHSKYEAIIRKYPEQWVSLLTPRWEIPSFRRIRTETGS